MQANLYEKTHNLQGYFPYKYQWAFVLISDGLIDELSVLEEEVGKLSNVVFIMNNKSRHTDTYPMYTAMWAGPATRYLQLIDLPSFTGNWTLEMFYPNLWNGLNGQMLTMTTLPWDVQFMKHVHGNTTIWTGFVIDVVDIIKQQLNFRY